MLGRQTVTRRVEQELVAIRDRATIDLIRRYLVEPFPVRRNWDYGSPGQTYVCWTVLEHPPSNTGVAYCEQGFGPDFPWGLVFLSGPYMSMGMDSNWYASLGQAVRESMAWEGPGPL
jgi:hypothetical protein